MRRACLVDLDLVSCFARVGSEYVSNLCTGNMPLINYNAKSSFSLLSFEFRSFVPDGRVITKRTFAHYVLVYY